MLLYFAIIFLILNLKGTKIIKFTGVSDLILNYDPSVNNIVLSEPKKIKKGKDVVYLEKISGSDYYIFVGGKKLCFSKSFLSAKVCDPDDMNPEHWEIEKVEKNKYFIFSRMKTGVSSYNKLCLTYNYDKNIGNLIMSTCDELEKNKKQLFEIEDYNKDKTYKKNLNQEDTNDIIETGPNKVSEDYKTDILHLKNRNKTVSNINVLENENNQRNSMKNKQKESKNYAKKGPLDSQRLNGMLSPDIQSEKEMNYGPK